MLGSRAAIGIGCLVISAVGLAGTVVVEHGGDKTGGAHAFWVSVFLIPCLVGTAAFVVYGVQDVRRSPVERIPETAARPPDEFRGWLGLTRFLGARNWTPFARLAFDDRLLGARAPGWAWVAGRADVRVVRVRNGPIWTGVSIHPTDRRRTVEFRTRDHRGVVAALRAHRWPVEDNRRRVP
jgi:hypothetical protein